MRRECEEREQQVRHELELPWLKAEQSAAAEHPEPCSAPAESTPRTLQQGDAVLLLDISKADMEVSDSISGLNPAHLLSNYCKMEADLNSNGSLIHSAC